MMKTYSRKKVGETEEEEEIIFDLNELCRLCMSKENELTPIFVNEDTMPLSLRIMACVALEVFEGDGLPSKICHPCKFQLSKFYEFRKKCESSNYKLTQLFSSLKGNETDEQNDMTDTQTGAMEIDDYEGKVAQSEEDLVGVTQVAYIQHAEAEIEYPESITLRSERNSREACTLKKEITSVLSDFEDTENIFIIDAEDTKFDEANLSVIADAVKATLASQPGLVSGGQLQLKVNSSEGKGTQVEVTTDDGSVLLLELTAEDTNELMEEVEEEEEKDFKVNEDGELKIFKCPHCPKSFARRIQLRRHASVHMQRGYSCGICEKWFPTRSALVRHERIHTGERPFQCEVCQKSFAQKEILFRHLMTHSGQKPYNCSYCSKGFSQKEPLRVHMKSHSLEPNNDDIELHYCSLCPKIFCHASGLSRHLVTHTGKMFKCKICEKSFTDQSALKRHHRQTGHMN